MKRLFSIHLIILSLGLLICSNLHSNDYIIYSIVQDIPMGVKDEVPKKNFYINLGQHQGVNQGTILDVFRTLSRLDPYSSKQRYTYSVRIGELKVLHSEENAAIAKLNKIDNGDDTPLYEIDGFMIGDKVQIKIKK